MFGGVFLLVLPPLSTKTRLRQRRRPSFVSKKAVLPHHGWNRSRVGRHSQVCLFKCHARCDVPTRFDNTLIRFCQTHLLTFFCSSFERCARQQRIWDIQNRRHIRAPQREEVTDDGTDYEVHRESAICHSRCRCDATSFFLSRAFFFAHHERRRRRRLRARWWWSRSFSLFFFLPLSLPPWSNRTRVPLLTECSRM